MPDKLRSLNTLTQFSCVKSAKVQSRPDFAGIKPSATAGSLSLSLSDSGAKAGSAAAACSSWGSSWGSGSPCCSSCAWLNTGCCACIGSSSQGGDSRSGGESWTGAVSLTGTASWTSTASGTEGSSCGASGTDAISVTGMPCAADSSTCLTCFACLACSTKDSAALSTTASAAIIDSGIWAWAWVWAWVWVWVCVWGSVIFIWPACCCGLKASIRNKAISKPACRSGASSKSLRAIIPIW